MFRSLQWRLQAWHALILLLVVAGFGSALYLETQRGWFDEIDAELLAGTRVIEGVLRTLPRDRPERDSSNEMTEDAFPAGEFPGRLRLERGGRARFGMTPEKEKRFTKDQDDHHHAPFDQTDDHELPEPLKRPRTPPRDGRERALTLPAMLLDRHLERGEPPYLVVRDRLGGLVREDPVGIAETVPPVLMLGPDAPIVVRSRGLLREVALLGPGTSTIVVGRPIGRELGGLRRTAIKIVLTGLSVFVAGLFGGWWLSSKAVRPIVSMSETVSTIGADNLSRRLDLTDVDTELGRLGALINTMLERIEAAFDQQARFTADASHELRTPLAVIRSQVELALARPREGEAYREALAACGRAATRMTGLVDGLLTLARVDAGHLELREETVDLGKVVAEVLAMLTPMAREHRVSLTSSGVGLPVRGDSERLSRVLTNLVTNAILYNRPGGSVSVALSDELATVCLRVIDTGVGISSEDLPHLFERFYRVDRARTRETGGNGLGLAICQGIVEAHGGTLTAESTLGEGTTLTVRLPSLAE